MLSVRGSTGQQKYASVVPALPALVYLEGSIQKLPTLRCLSPPPPGSEIHTLFPTLLPTQV